MKKILQQNKILLYAIVFALIFCTVFFAVQDLGRVAFAQSESFDDINVLDDLQSSTVNGKPFDILDYAFDETKRLQIVNFVEYCYSYKLNMQSHYGVYIYVYNPQGLNLVENSGQNKIQMAVAWAKNDDGTYSATRYEKFNLKFCNKSEKANYLGLFYKFKVVDKKIDGKSMVERVNSNERRYDVSGIELLTSGNTNATEYTVGGTYKFTGYAKGFGNTDEDTLSCAVSDLETLKLEVHHTYYRTNVSSLGKGHYNEINTVYFSVPDRIFKDYGNLQKIRAEWWEYKTKMALISGDKAFANKALKYVGVDIGEYGDRNKVPYGLTTENLSTSSSSASFAWTYNEPESDSGIYIGSRYRQTILPMVFYSASPQLNSFLNLFYTAPVAGEVEGSEVANYIYNYKNDLGHGYIDCNGRQISKDLFETTVDSGRTIGHNDKAIDLSDTFDLKSYDSNHSWFDKLFDYGFSWPSTDGDYKDVLPIYEVKDEDLSGADLDSIASKLLINRDNVDDFRLYYSAQKALGNHVILFRFANTDYYAEEVAEESPELASTHFDNRKRGYIAQMTCFFDFDIIELTFNKNGTYKVIPVVSSPMDIINGFNPPPSGLEWWKIVLAVLLLILLLVLLAPILPYIINFVFWLVKLPFKLIGRLATLCKRSKSEQSINNNQSVSPKDKKYKYRR